MNVNRVEIAQLSERRTKNLKFFAKYFPDIYLAFENFSPRGVEIKINHSEQFDLLLSQQSLYHGDAKKYAIEEVERFLALFPRNKKISPHFSIFKPFFSIPRFANATVKTLAPELPDDVNDPSMIAQHQQMIPDFYPALVVLGVGLGFHIEHLLEKKSVINLNIVEPNSDVFAMSLFSVDWEKILSPFQSTNARRVTFTIGGYDNVDAHWRLLWNNLIQQCPTFPGMTLFYTHKNNSALSLLESKVQSHIQAYTTGWGNYDDEINQLNQACHNITRGGFFIKTIDSLSLDQYNTSNLPICIIGSGPSLDARIDFLLQNREKLFIASCGSSITALQTKGIKPDIHFELESDYLYTVGYLETIADSHYFKGISLIAPIHINPYVVSYFENVYYFLKEDSSIVGIQEALPDTIQYCGPTCTNLAMSAMLKLGAKTLMLMGMDFGFKDVKYHHTLHSIYNNKDANPLFHEVTGYNEKHLIKLQSISGDQIFCPAIYFTAKTRIEACLQAQRIQYPNDELNIYNCSDGAVIDGTQHLTFYEQTQLAFKWSNIDGNKNTVCSVLDFFSYEALPCSHDYIHKRIHDRLSQLIRISHSIQNILNIPIMTLLDFVCRCNRINHYLEAQVKEQWPGAYFMLSGTLYNFLFVGFSEVTKVYQTHTELDQYMDIWQKTFLEFLHNLPEHARQVLEKDYVLTEDAWLTTTIGDAPLAEPFMNK